MVLSSRHKYRHPLIISLIFLGLYLASALLYSNYQHRQDHRTVANHARIIADDIWAINPTGVENYLRLAMEAKHYHSIEVTITGNEPLLYLESPEPDGVTGFFNRIGLIPTRELHEVIRHGELTIGELRVTQHVRLIFPLLNILALYLLLYLLTLFIFLLSDRHRILEDLVQERTRSLLESQNRFHDLVNLLPEMVLEVDLDGTVSYANSEARKRFGISQEYGSSNNLFEFFTADERHRARQTFHQHLEHGSLYQETLKDKDHRSFPALLRSAPILQAGKCVGARLLLIDITERQRMEEQLNQDQKMKAIGLMAGGVAHDLNNILSGIVSYPEILMLDLDQESPLHRPLSIIRKAGLEAAEVVTDLLTVARGSRGDLETVQPNSLIREYLASPDFTELRSRLPLVELTFSPAADLLPLSCSAIHIRKCLMNLVMNAFEAIDGKGRVCIATENVDHNDLQPPIPGLPPNQGAIRITVSDTGQGIEESELEHIFEPFYSKKVMGRSGTGLGLTVVWNTVRDHGGITRVNSSKEGTSFTLLFPAATGAATPEQPSPALIQRGGGETVLVIDDEPRQRDIATTLLRSLGYTVATAATGEEAWSYLEQHSADLVVLDMLMGPEQPNGREIYQEILTIRPGQRAIIASGYAEDEDVRQTLEMGARAFVPKPYTLATISRAVYTTLRAPAPEQSPLLESLPG